MKSLILKSPEQLELSGKEATQISPKEVFLNVKVAAIYHTYYPHFPSLKV